MGTDEALDSITETGTEDVRVRKMGTLDRARQSTHTAAPGRSLADSAEPASPLDVIDESPRGPGTGSKTSVRSVSSDGSNGDVSPIRAGAAATPPTRPNQRRSSSNAPKRGGGASLSEPRVKLINHSSLQVRPRAPFLLARVHDQKNPFAHTAHKSQHAHSHAALHALPSSGACSWSTRMTSC